MSKLIFGEYHPYPLAHFPSLWHIEWTVQCFSRSDKSYQGHHSDSLQKTSWQYRELSEPHPRHHKRLNRLIVHDFSALKESDKPNETQSHADEKVKRSRLIDQAGD
jgi:hypothetical protein